MKNRTLLLRAILGSSLLLLATSSIAQEKPETAAVLATVRSLLDGWREADANKLEAVLHKDFREVTLHLKDKDWNFAVVDRKSLIEMMAKIQKNAWDDRLIDPQAKIDGPIATVWSHYRFTVNYAENGIAHAAVHCGIETFQLYRIGSEWKIVNFADTHSDICQ